MKRIKADELNKILSEDPRARVINVLDEEMYRKQHIPGTVNIPVSDPDFVNKVESQTNDKSAPVIVYCANTECNASDKAAEKLEQAGFRDVRDFAAGTKGWEQAGHELEGSAVGSAR
ncbi:MAG: rhodanese-like domain-containing protein [Phycisphaerales bacterium]|nr:rhodanese-like domain-containing protein [Planctomycetota bacterium]MCH8508616.1 rhodanese-like domain-containing protein [Phycisphaerales bacterium]